jgi:hypothetical protein
MTMRRRVNKRSQLILGIFVPVLLVGTAAYIYHVIAGSPVKAAEKPAARAKTTRARSATGKPAAKAKPSGYTVIAQRNLFQPLIAPPKVTTPPPPKPQPPSPPVNIPNVFAPPPMPDASLAAHSPAMDKIAVVGSVRVGDELYVLVEDLAKGDTRYVKAGDSAFGYTVKAASIDDATLERDGQTYKVAMGEGKVGAPVRAGAGMGRTFTPMGGPMPPPGAPPMANPAFPGGGIPDLANMSSDQRRQWFDQWRQSFQNMSPEQQEQARQQMRDYWRQRSDQGGLGGSGGGGRDGGGSRFNSDGNRGGFGGERRFSFGGSQPAMVGSSVTFGGRDAPVIMSSPGSGTAVYRYRDR